MFLFEYKGSINTKIMIKYFSSEEPEWVDVVTELLLSLLMQSSHLVRVVVGNVFSMLVPLITDQSIQLILDVSGSIISCTPYY